MAEKKDTKPAVYSKISISLASPEEILAQSSGEVSKPETINYRTYKPERDGLFCEHIFGPVKDYECHCGKYKGIRYKGIVCDRCSVEVTEKKVRRERMGHISLVVPVVHIWYFKSLPSKIGYLLGIPSKRLESIIYYEKYVVVNAGAAEELAGVHRLDTLAEKEYTDVLEKLPKGNQQLPADDPNKFVAMIGAEAIKYLLSQVKLESLSNELRDQAFKEKSQQRKSEILKQLNVVEMFKASNGKNKPEWMVMDVIPVIPPELRPLVPLDGGRFATSDLNDLYRRVIIRNNRLKRLIEIKAPDVILRNEKRMLQEAVDSLFDNSRKSNAVKSESNRALKSLSDSLKGKQGRFRQNLLGKRVDYSARSVIVVGPELKMHEMGIPKDMAAELYKPFIIRKLIERGIVKTVKSAKKIIDRKDPVIWGILENVIKGHPVLMNRAPTLHRLGIQAFQPKLIEGKAMQLHPLACTAFNADFDGDQMAVHLPLGNAAILEAQLLMLGSHNVLNPANGAPITVPSQDMVLGLYYITKIFGHHKLDKDTDKALIDKRKAEFKAKGIKALPWEDVLDPTFKLDNEHPKFTFYSPEEAIIAYNSKKVDIHDLVACRVRTLDENGNEKYEVRLTSVGRLLFNQVVPEEVGFVNELLTKKSLRNIIAYVMKKAGADKVANFLDDIKNLGYKMAFKGGLSFNLDAVVIPESKAKLVNEGYEKADAIIDDYNNGFITNNERYNQIIDVWTNVNNKLTKEVVETLTKDNDGFNPVFMMLDSGARGSKEQIRQLSGMRGLMAKPQKSGVEGGQQVIENPILSNFKEGLSVLEYFISTHGARKGLADTALKTADAGYLTRRLVDVAQDVIVNEEDCGTLRGLTATAIKRNDVVVQSLYDRILGRTALNDVINPSNGEVICKAGEEITEDKATAIEQAQIESVDIRSALTCVSRHGVCAKCYGRNLATARMVQKGEVVGVIAAQSIGEPGTQLTLRTFHVGGVAGGSTVETNVTSKYEGKLEIEELRTIKAKKTDKADANNKAGEIVISRQSEIRIINPTTEIVLYTHALPYGSTLYMHDGDMVKKGDLICEWDPYNAVIISENEGKAVYENVIEGVTYREERDEQTGMSERVIIDSKDRTKSPVIRLIDKNGEEIKMINLPVTAHVVVKDNAKIHVGDVLVKIPRVIGKSGGDITGGLPRVTELFEARNPSNPAIVTEIDGEVTFGKIKRGNREIVITAKDGEERRYLVPLSRQIVVQENDYVKAGMPLSDGAITPGDILRILGPTRVQEYIVNEVQEVYRMQGVTINDKHFEIIVRQMMNKVQIVSPGDTRFFENQIVDKWEFMDVNDDLFDKMVVMNAGDSQDLEVGQIISARKLRDENSTLKRKDLQLVQAREAEPATSSQILQGITRAALQTPSFISAASFQETTKVLNEAAIQGKTDPLENLKENVICGHLIPGGTGQRDFDGLTVGLKSDVEFLTSSEAKE